MNLVSPAARTRFSELRQRAGRSPEPTGDEFNPRSKLLVEPERCAHPGEVVEADGVGVRSDCPDQWRCGRRRHSRSYPVARVPVGSRAEARSEMAQTRSSRTVTLSNGSRVTITTGSNRNRTSFYKTVTVKRRDGTGESKTYRRGGVLSFFAGAYDDSVPSWARHTKRPARLVLAAQRAGLPSLLQPAARLARQHDCA